MPNTTIAELITRHITTHGLPHPGNPEANQPAFNIPLPGFRTTGMAPEMSKHVDTTAKLFGEAAVHLIETEGESVIIGRAELDRLRADDQEPGEAVPIVCDSCRESLFYLTARNGIFTLSKAGLAAVAGIKHQCDKAI